MQPIPQAPGTKAARHGAIVEILATTTVTSQEELRQLLASQGIETVQATLSRDLVELHATKVRNADGMLVYSVPDIDGTQTHEVEGSWARLNRWTADLLLSGDIALNQLVLRTPIGAANLLGSVIDAARLPGVIGTIAGDDTVLVICRDASSASQLLENLTEIANSNSAGKKKDR